jgi:hypothetical protein
MFLINIFNSYLWDVGLNYNPQKRRNYMNIANIKLKIQKYKRFIVELDIGLVPLSLNSVIIGNLIILEFFAFWSILKLLHQFQ